MKNLSAAGLFSVTLVGTSATGLFCLALIDSSLKSTFLLIVASAACLILVRASAAMRHVIWSTTMLGLLLMPACALLLPHWHVLPTWLSLEQRFEQTLPTSLPIEDPLPAMVDTIQTDALSFTSVAPFTLEDLESTLNGADPLVAVAEPIHIRLQSTLVIGIWAAGCMFGLLPMVIGFLRLRQLEQKFTSEGQIDSKLSCKIKKIACDLGICEPRLIIGPKGAMPMVWSFGRSRILLPSDIDQWPEARLNSVLLHEMIHLRRHDPAVCAIGLVACAVNWFNPFAWYAIHRLRIECEQACDDRVLQMGVDAIDYATHLLELSTSVCLASRAGSLALAMASKPLVECRIASILDEKLNRNGVTLFRALALLAAVSIGVVLVASMATRNADKHMPVVETSEVEHEIIGIDVRKFENQLSELDPLVDRTVAHIELSLEECISYALANSQPAVTDQNGNRVRPRSASLTNQVDGVEGALSEFDAQMSISKKTANGGVATLRSQSISSFNNIPTQPTAVGKFGQAVPTEYSQILDEHVQHPFLRARGGSVNRFPIASARINKEVAIGQIEERTRNLVRDIEFAYWDLFVAYFNVDTARTAVDSAANTWKNAKLNSSANDAKAQASVTYHQFRAQLDAAIAGGPTTGPGLFGREQNLRLLMGWDTNDGRLIRPSDKPAIGRAVFDWDAARDETLRRNSEIRRQRWVIKQRELELMSAKSQTLPNVYESLNYRWLGVGNSLIDCQSGNQPIPNGLPSAFEELFGSNYHEGGIRMEYNPKPFGSRRLLYDVKNKQLALAREHRILEAKEIAAVHRLSALLHQVEIFHKEMTQQLQAFNAAKTLVHISQAKFDAGDSSDADATIDNLLRAQQCRSTSGQNYTRALAEYNKSLVEIHAIKGSLLEYNKLALN